jgi:tetratricopeptide (TPR) repeat protein
MLVCPSCRALTPAGHDTCIQCRAPLHRPTFPGNAIPRGGDSIPPLPASDSVPPPPLLASIAPPPPSPRDKSQVQVSFMPREERPAAAQAGTGTPPSREKSSRAAKSDRGRILYVRKKELRTLEKHFKVSIGRNSFGGAMVTGEEGMGVSTLLRMAATRISMVLPRDRIHYSVCREHSDPFFPFSRLLRRVFETEDAADTNSLRIGIASKVGRMLEGAPASVIAETTHLLGFMTGVPFTKSTILKSLQSDPEILYQKLKESLLRFFFVNLKDGPRALILDDVHKMQNGSRAQRLFIEVVSELKAAPLFVICGGAEGAALMQGESVISLKLAPLSEKVMKNLFASMMPRLEHPPADLVTKTLRQAAGNPGALYNLCSLLKESGVINTEDDEWTVDLDQLSSIPVDQQDTLKARLDRIDPRDRQVLQTAALFGDVFWDEAIVAMSRLTVRLKKNINPGEIWADDSDALAISSSLERLVERKFIVSLFDRDIRGTMKYSFAHSGIRERIIGTIDKKRQKQYHLLAAEWLSHTASKFGPFLSEIESEHWIRGGDPYKAAMSCFRAARQSSALYLNQKANELFQKGLAILGPDEWLARIDALHDLSTLHELQNNLKAAEHCLTEMLRNAWIIAHRGKAGAALNKIGRLYRARGDSVAARAFINRGMSLFRATGDDAGVAACLGDLGELARQDGQIERASSLVREAFEIQRKQRNRRSMAVSLHSLGNIEADRASYEKAERYFTEALEMRRRINDRSGMAQTTLALAAMMLNRGDAEGAMGPLGSALELAVEVGDRRTEAMAHSKLGQALRELARYKEALNHFRLCEEIAAAQNDQRLLAEVLCNQAMLAVKMGELEAGRKQVEQALHLARQLDSKETEGFACFALGEIEATTMWDTSTPDGEDRASEAFGKALAAFRSIGNEFEVARTLYAMGNRMLERGDLEGSRTSLKEAGEIFKRINSPLSQRIDRTIRETSEPREDENIGMFKRMRKPK